MRLNPRQVSALRSTALRQPKQSVEALEQSLLSVGVNQRIARIVADKIVQAVMRNQMQSARLHTVLLGTAFAPRWQPGAFQPLRSVRGDGRHPSVSSMTVRRAAESFA